MKRSVWYLLCVLALGGMFSACYYFSYQSALKKWKEREKQQEISMFHAGGEQAEKMFATLIGTAQGAGAASDEARDYAAEEEMAEKKDSGMEENGFTGYEGGKAGFSDGLPGGSLNGTQGGISNGAQGGLLNGIQGGISSGAQGGLLNGTQGGLSSGAQGDSVNASKGDSEIEAVPADAIKEARILPQTKFLLETFEVTTGDFAVEEKQPDAAMIGMTKDQLLAYLEEELSDMPIREYQKGLYVNELITFSENKVIVRKTYDASRVDFLYYLAVKNGEVVVYYSDLKTVYEYTGIHAAQLKEEERLMLLDGIRIKTAEELFSLLESYSS